MKQLFFLLVIAWLAAGSPIAQEENQGFIGDSGDGFVIAVADDEQQSIAVLNLGDEKVINVEVNQGDNYRYETKNEADNGYQWGYDVEENDTRQFRHEIKRPDGTVLGRYGYNDPNGDLRITNYISDREGFQVLHPGVLVQLEPVLDNENVKGNEIRGRSNLVVDELEPEIPILNVPLPPGAINLQAGDNSYGYFLKLR